jgi:hypothetical protein
MHRIANLRVHHTRRWTYPGLLRPIEEAHEPEEAGNQVQFGMTIATGYSSS